MSCGAEGLIWCDRCLVKYSKRPAPRELRGEELDFGKVLNPDHSPRIPPPDLWLQADEGDLVPWGWLSAPPAQRSKSPQDSCFWDGFARKELVRWVQDMFQYKDAPNVPASCPECRC